MSSVKTWTTHSADETMRVGRELAAMLTAPTMLILRGDLGAGKTTLVKGIAAALGVAEAEDVTSPTFTLVHEYAPTSQKRDVGHPNLSLFHLDLYRLEKERELDALGIDEMMQDAIVLIEWGEKFTSLAGRADGEIAIERSDEMAGGDVRKITLRLNK